MNRCSGSLVAPTPLGLVVLGLVGLTACSPTPPAPAPPAAREVILSVSTVDLQGKPVESVAFYINQKKYGITDQDGRFQGRYPAKPGDALAFNVEPPEGYSVPASPEQGKWRVVVEAPVDAHPREITFRAELLRPKREYVLMVRGAPATPVQVGGVAVGFTSLAGDALLSIAGIPGTPLQANAGALTYTGTFSEEEELYLLTPGKTGPVEESGPDSGAPPLPAGASAPPPAGAPTPPPPPPPNGASAPPPPAGASSAPPTPPPATAPGLEGPGGPVVASSPAGGAVPAPGGPSPAALSREEIDTHLAAIRAGLDRSGVLSVADVSFLGQIERAHPGYFEAHRLLAAYHHTNKDFRRQADELEIATSAGRYRRDPTLLLSLAQAYGKQARSRDALRALQRVEENMRTLPAGLKAEAFPLRAEMYEAEYRRQAEAGPDDAGANVSLLDKAIREWERAATFLRGADNAGAARAEARKAKLEELKSALDR